MVKGGLSKFKCMIKRWQSSSRISRTTSGGGSRGGGEQDDQWVGGGGRTLGSASFHGADDGVPPGLHPVFVGQSRRRYLIAADLVGHPLFQNLVNRSGGDGGVAGDGGRGTTIGCEVVLFEHLLWMLENADPQPESLDELVEYYAC